MRTGYRYIDDVETARVLGLAGPRDRTAHLHTLDGKALFGTSTVNGYAKEGGALMQYASDRAAVAALAFPQVDIREEYEAAQALTDSKAKREAMNALDAAYPDFAKARRAADSHKDKAARKGTKRHGVLEDYVRACIDLHDGKPFVSEVEYEPAVEAFINWSLENVDRFVFTEAHAYSEKLWIGGICDIGFILKDGRRAIGDHKSSPRAYKEQFRQAALYDIQLTESGGLTRDGKKVFEWEPADCAIIFPFRSDPFQPEIIEDMKALRLTAEYLAALYRWNERLTPTPM